MSGLPEDPEAQAPALPPPDWAGLYRREPFEPRSLLPPLTWLPRYVRSLRGLATVEDAAAVGSLPYSLQGDAIAGLTVGVMLVPQGLAFALLSGLPVQTGLFSAFAPLIVYALFGTMRQVQTGPAALINLLTGQALDSIGVADPSSRMAGASLMALLVGVISLLLGAAGFGAIADLMSHSVVSAFCTAAGVTIATSQLKHILGVPVSRHPFWWETVGSLAAHARQIHGPTVALGGTALAVLLGLKYWKSAGSAERRRKHLVWRWFPKERSSRAFKAMKLLADLSALLAVTLGALWAWAYRRAGVEGVRLVGEVDAEGFVFVLPGSGTHEHLLGSSHFVESAVIIAIIGFLESVAVGGKFAAQYRYEYSPNQDLLALGLSNIASAFMSGFPVTVGFSRTAVNVVLGATSLLACAMSSLVVLLTMYFLLPAISTVPLASMAPIVVQGAVAFIDIHEFRVALRSRPGEFLVMLATFVVSLALTVKEGLLTGFALSALKTLHDIAFPNLAVCGQVQENWRDVRHFPSAEQRPDTVVVRMDASLHFVNARKLKEFCLRALRLRERSGDGVLYLVIDAKSLNGVDLTGCEMLGTLAEVLQGRGQSLIIANLKAPIASCLASAGVQGVIQKHGGQLCLDMQDAMAAISTAEPGWSDARERVQTLIQSAAKIERKALCRTNLTGASDGGRASAAP